MSQLASLAARVGLPVPTQSATQTPQFYADFVVTHTFLRKLAADSYSTGGVGAKASGNLIRVLDREDPDSQRALQETIEHLRGEVIQATSNLRTSVVTVSVRTESPVLSEQIARNTLRLVDEFNVGNRRFLADAERQFMQDRVAATETELRSAEDQLQRFLQANREFRQDPRLAFEHDRLQRVVGMRQQVFTALNEALEQARLEAIRNTPSISVVIPPVRALVPDKRNLVFKVIGVALGGFLLAVFFAFSREALRSQRASVDAEEFARLREASLADLRRLLGPMARKRISAVSQP
jgi:uncharacterized protein involved in exopolysaccharide biosynthesis